MKATKLYSDLLTICKRVAYGAFKARQDTPFIVYLQSADVSGGDSNICITNNHYRIELYDTKRNVEMESKIESLLASYQVEYDVIYATYINDSKQFVTVYEFDTFDK